MANRMTPSAAYSPSPVTSYIANPTPPALPVYHGPQDSLSPAVASRGALLYTLAKCQQQLRDAREVVADKQRMSQYYRDQRDHFKYLYETLLRTIQPPYDASRAPPHTSFRPAPVASHEPLVRAQVPLASQPQPSSSHDSVLAPACYPPARPLPPSPLSDSMPPPAAPVPPSPSPDTPPGLSHSPSSSSSSDSMLHAAKVPRTGRTPRAERTPLPDRRQRYGGVGRTPLPHQPQRARPPPSRSSCPLPGNPRGLILTPPINSIPRGSTTMPSIQEILNDTDTNFASTANYPYQGMGSFPLAESPASWMRQH